MTYCLGVKVNEGLLLASDSRTNAGVDSVATFHKLFVFHQPGERLIVVMTAGNRARHPGSDHPASTGPENG
jgi:putative proteasome-type protease